MTTFITDKDGNQANASGTTVPSDRHFRGAWSLSGTVITEDLTAAKVIFKDSLGLVEFDANTISAEDINTFINGIAGGEMYKASEASKKATVY